MLDEVRDQPEGVRFLRRVVEGHLTSPLLLVGDEGVGRRFSVTQAVLEMFCTGTHCSGCGCVDCVQVGQGIHPDLTVLAPEGDREIGVDAVRDLIETATVFPMVAPYRILVVDGADRLTMAAANALLKTLEEPPPSARFFLLAESLGRVIPTIRSRCGVVSYHALSEAMVLSVLGQFEDDPAKALVYARLGEGSIGRATRYWGSGRLMLRDKTFSLIRLALERDVASLFSAVDAMDKELVQVLVFLRYLTHDLLMVTTDPTRVLNTDLVEDLVQMQARRPPSVWHQLNTVVGQLREQTRSTRLALAFHIKTRLVETLAV